MSIRLKLLGILAFMPVIINAQTFSDYSLENLTTTATYGEGERQSNAQNALAIRYANGEGGAAKNPAKALYWYTQSANNGNQYAMYNLAYCYRDGKGTQKNNQQAAYWMEKSAQKYFADACITIGKWYYNGDGISQNYNKAITYLKDAAFMGDSEAMYYMANCYAYGNGAPQDSTKAVFWANRAIDEGAKYAYFILGRMYRDGLSVVKNPGIAIVYFKDGCKENVISCYGELGYGFERGLFGREEDYVAAEEYYTKGAQAGSAYCMEQLAGLYFYTTYNMVDLQKSSYWYKKLLDSRYDSKIAERLSSIYNYLEDYRSAHNMYVTRGEHGDPWGYNQLAYMYADGKGVSKDMNQALIYIDRAIELSPDDPNFLDSKGELLLKKGDIKGATKLWKQIAKNYPLFYSEYNKEHKEHTVFYDYMTSQSK